MRNKSSWQPGKFVCSAGQLAATRDSDQLGVASRLAANLVGRMYSIHMPRYTGGRLLDLGCGQVPLWELYQDLVEDNVCIDWQQSAPGAAFYDAVADLNAPLPLASDSFDTVLLSDVLEHIREPAALLSEIERILVPGGRLILNVPFYYWLHEQPHDYYRYTRFGLEYLAEQADLEIVLLEPVGGALEVLSDISGKLVSSLPLLGRPLAGLLQGISMIFFRSGLGQRACRKTADYFPFGYFIVAQKPMT